MREVRIHLPDQLYDAVNTHGIPVSEVARQALEEALRRQLNAEWIERAHSREPRTQSSIDTSALIGEARDEFGESKMSALLIDKDGPA